MTEAEEEALREMASRYRQLAGIYEREAAIIERMIRLLKSAEACGAGSEQGRSYARRVIELLSHPDAIGRVE